MRLISIISLFFISISSFCEEIKDLNAFNIKNNFLAFRVDIFKQLGDHRETSSASGYSTLAKQTESSIQALSLHYSREFFSKRKFSLTICASRGINTGGGAAVDNELGVEYETEIRKGSSTSVGLSLNYNFIYTALKVQPFLSFSIHQDEFNTKTKYNPTSSQSVTVINYENEVKRNLITLGTRFFDPETRLMSLLSLSYKISEEQASNLSSATLSETPISLSNSNTNVFATDDLSFSIMAGYSF